MRAGLLRHRLKLQSPVPLATGDSGNPDATAWRDEITVWGAVEPLGVREQLIGKTVDATATHHVRVRYHAPLSQTWRIMFGTRIFDIESIIVPESRRVEMQLVVREQL